MRFKATYIYRFQMFNICTNKDVAIRHADFYVRSVTDRWSRRCEWHDDLMTMTMATVILLTLSKNSSAFYIWPRLISRLKEHWRCRNQRRIWSHPLSLPILFSLPPWYLFSIFCCWGDHQRSRILFWSSFSPHTRKHLCLATLSSSIWTRYINVFASGSNNQRWRRRHLRVSLRRLAYQLVPSSEHLANTTQRPQRLSGKQAITCASFKDYTIDSGMLFPYSWRNSIQ